MPRRRLLAAGAAVQHPGTDLRTEAAEALTLDAERAIPLALIGTGIAFAFRAGVFNIGGEGQLLLGAFSAALLSSTTVALFEIVGRAEPVVLKARRRLASVLF